MLQLDLVFLPINAKYFICGLALVNLIVSLVAEDFFLPYLSELIGASNIAAAVVKIKISRLGEIEDEEASQGLLRTQIAVAEEARRENWLVKGKIFKVVEAQMRAVEY